jgi:ParB family chromosome partitioning protein
MSLTRSVSDDGEQGVQEAERALAAASGGSGAPELRALPLEAIQPNPSQPRSYFDETALGALALKARGVLQPVLVRPGPDGSYELIAGERRWRAALLAGMEKIPALLYAHDDAAALEIALVENMVREDLSLLEEARACETLAKELGLSSREIGERVSRSGSAVANLRRLLNLSEEILELLERGQLRMAHGLALLAAKDPEARADLARKAVEGNWTVLALEARARESNKDIPGLQEKTRAPRQARQGGTQEQDLDESSLAVAKAWGDLVDVEVHVRPMAYGRVRLEVQFNSPEAALAAAGRLAQARS